MLFEILEAVFFGALIINALLFLPQILLLLKIKNSDSVSLLMFCSFAVIQFISIIYGYMKQDFFMVIGYSASLLTCVLTIFLVIYFRKPRDK